jgi:hypothetical protein
MPNPLPELKIACPATPCLRNVTKQSSFHIAVSLMNALELSVYRGQSHPWFENALPLNQIKIVNS